MADVVRAEFIKFSDEQQKRTLRGLNERIETLRNTLNTRNIESKCVDDTFVSLFSDYEDFIGSVLYVFEKGFTKDSGEAEFKQYLTAAVTYCNAETCFQALLVACIAKCTCVRSRYEPDSSKFKEITSDIVDRRYVGASFLEPHTGSKMVKIYQLRSHGDEYKCVEAFRESIGLDKMP